jgi:uncharacterized protein
MAANSKRVAVLGASAKADKYSYKAVEMLLQYGYEPLPVHPSGREVCGVSTAKSLKDLTGSVDTLSMYVGPDTSAKLTTEILELKPRRIIMNPGAENPQLKEAAEKKGIEVIEGCTLVMLRTGNFG